MLAADLISSQIQAGIPGMAREWDSMPVRSSKQPASLQAEISPPHARGLLSGWTQLMIVIGFLVSFIFGIGGLWKGWLTLALDQQVANCKLWLDSSMCRSLSLLTVSLDNRGWIWLSILGQQRSMACEFRFWSATAP